MANFYGTETPSELGPDERERRRYHRPGMIATIETPAQSRRRRRRETIRRAGECAFIVFAVLAIVVAVACSILFLAACGNCGMQ